MSDADGAQPKRRKVVQENDPTEKATTTTQQSIPQVLASFLDGSVDVSHWSQVSRSLEDFRSETSPEASSTAPTTTNAQTEQATTSQSKEQQIDSDQEEEEDDDDSDNENKESSSGNVQSDEVMDVLLRWNAHSETPTTTTGEGAPGDIDDILSLTFKTKRRRGRSEAYRKKHELRDNLQMIMGQANQAFANKELEKAIQLCNQVIISEPFAPDPYTTLAMIYSEKGDSKLAFRYKLIESTCLPESDVDWVRIAETFKEMGELKQALKFYEKALRRDPYNIDIRLEKSHTLLTIGLIKKAMDEIVVLFDVVGGAADPRVLISMQTIIQTVTTKEQEKKSAVIAALNALKKVFEGDESVISAQHLIIYVDLLTTTEQYPKALKVVENHYLKAMDSTRLSITETIEISENMTIPLNLSPVLLVKIGICLLNIAETVEIGCKFLVASLQTIDPVNHFQLFTESIDALMTLWRHREALIIINKVLKIERFNKPYIWLKQAKCLYAAGDYFACRDRLMEVFTIVANHNEAKQLLFLVYKKLGENDLASSLNLAINTTDLKTLENNLLIGGNSSSLLLVPKGRAAVKRNARTTKNTSAESTSLPFVDLEAEYQEMIQEYNHGNAENCVDLSLKLFAYFLKYYARLIAKKAKDLVIEYVCPPFPGVDIIKESTVKLSTSSNKALVYEGNEFEGVLFDGDSLPHDRWFELSVRACQSFLHLGYSTEALALSHNMIRYEKLCECNNENHLFALRCLKADAATAYGDIEEAVRILKFLCFNPNSSIRLWNKLYDLHFRSSDPKNNFRAMIRYVDNAAPDNNKRSLSSLLIRSNRLLMSGFPTGAANTYIKAYSIQPTDPYICLALSAALIQMLSSKYSATERHKLAAQAVSFMSVYFELRGGFSSAEACYNFGRIYQQICMNHKAIHYYNRVFELADLNHDFHYCYEAASNLSLIYKSSGSWQLARQLLRKYCSV